MNFWVKPEKQAIFIAKFTKKQFLLTNSGVITSILGVSGLESLSCSTEPVISLGHNSRLGGGHNSSLGGTSSDLGGHGHGMPYGGAGPVAHAASRVTFYGYFESISTKQCSTKFFRSYSSSNCLLI